MGKGLFDFWHHGLLIRDLMIYWLILKIGMVCRRTIFLLLRRLQKFRTRKCWPHFEEEKSVNAAVGGDL